MDQIDVQAMYAPIREAAEAERAWSAQQAEKAMAWQERMSDTAHQREVKDLIAAGLNPVLAAGGQGAAVGTGHAAQSSSAGVNALYGLISKAFEAQIKQAEALETTAKKVDTPVGKGTDAPIGQLITPKETMTKKERFDRDKAQYGTDKAYQLADTDDPWLREKIIDESGRSTDKKKASRESFSQAMSTVISKISLGYIDKTTAKKGLEKAFQAVEKPVDRLAGKLHQTGLDDKLIDIFAKEALKGTGLYSKPKEKDGSKFKKDPGSSGRKGKF